MTNAVRSLLPLQWAFIALVAIVSGFIAYIMLDSLVRVNTRRLDVIDAKLEFQREALAEVRNEMRLQRTPPRTP